MGAIVSASHNPAADNGIKLLSAHGTKLTDADEDRIEERLRNPSTRIPGGDKIGTRFFDKEAFDHYVVPGLPRQVQLAASRSS